MKKMVTHARTTGRKKGTATSARRGAHGGTTTLVRPPGLIDCDQEPMEHITWLWGGRIPANMLSLLDGEGDMGKGTLLCDLMARVTRGDRMPFDHGRPRRPAAVLFLGTEEGLRNVVLPRLTVADADLHLVKPFDLTQCPRLPDDLTKIADTLRYTQQETGVPVRFIVCDPLTGVLGEGVKIGQEQSYRRAASALANFAERHRVTILSSRHLTKHVTAPARYRGLGGLVVFNLARAVFGVGVAPDDLTTRIFAPMKSNNAVKAPALRFRIISKPLVIKRRTETYPAIEWHEKCNFTADEIFKVAGQRATPKSDRAREVLQLLLQGDRPQKEMLGRAKKAGVSKKTLRNAAKVMGVGHKRISVPGARKGTGYSVWTLDPDQGGNHKTTTMVPTNPNQDGNGKIPTLMADTDEPQS